MIILRSKEMLRGLDISHVTLYDWINKEGMPTIKQNPYLFNTKALDWVKTNKPKYKQAVEKMINNYAESEGDNE